MNGQMNNQYQQQMPVNQPTMQPQQMPVNQPVMQPQQMPVSQPVMQPVKNSKSFKEVIADLKSKNVFKIIGIIAGALIILGVFLPMVTVKYGSLKESSNLWDSTTIERFIVMILGLVAILTYVFNKLKYLSNISAGAAFMISLSTFDAWIELSSTQRDYTYLSLAFFVFLLAAVVLIVLNVLDNLDELEALFKGKPKEHAPAINMNNMAQNSFNQPQPFTNQMPMNQTVQPVVCTNCGAKKVGSETFCSNCGKQF